MNLSETQEKELIKLYRDIKDYAYYLEHETYNPYEKVKKFAEELRKIIGDDEKINSIIL